MYLPAHYYVYAYLRDDGTPYYIGKGTGRRAWTKSRRIVSPPVDAQKIVIVTAGLSNIGALAIERRLIRWYGRVDQGTGILRNKTDGGDGSAGNVPSEETKLKMSRANKGRPKPQGFGEKISTKLRGEKNPRFGKPGTRLGVKETEEQCRAKSARYLTAPHPMTGSFWINDGCINKKLSAGSLIPDGWHKGRHFDINPRQCH
jgi:hypothetical protein